MRLRAGFLLAPLVLLGACNSDFSRVGGPNLDTEGLAISGNYPGYYPAVEPGTCAIKGSGMDRTLVFKTRGTRQLIPQVTVSIQGYHGKGRYDPPAGSTMVAALGRELSWRSAAGATFSVDREDGKQASGKLASDFLESDGIVANPISVTGGWTCVVTVTGS
ncbi:MAG: hypothetical protein ACYDGR_13775 [Candidatus Dormibacteria bacterium]